jgi:hypothetical protein
MIIVTFPHNDSNTVVKKSDIEFFMTSSINSFPSILPPFLETALRFLEKDIDIVLS